MTPREIGGLLALSERATKGPWEALPFDEQYPGDGVPIIGLRLGDDGKPLFTPTNGIVAAGVLLPTEIDALDPTRALDNAAFIVAAVNFVRNDLPALHAKIAELEGERDASEKHRNDLYDKVQAQLTEIGAIRAERDAASARVGEMREALEPFAAVGELIELETEGFDDTDTLDLMYDGYLLDRLPVADFRRARLARGEG